MNQTIEDLDKKKFLLKVEKNKWFEDAVEYNKRLNEFKVNLPKNPQEKERIHKELEKCHEELMKRKQKYDKAEVELDHSLSSSEKKKKQQQERQQLIEYLQEIDLSSPLATRIRDSAFEDEDEDFSMRITYSKIREYEKYCATSRNINQLEKTEQELSCSKSSRTKRLMRTNGGKTWGHLNYTHKYSFSRQQRLERYKVLETGLNWKSRLLLLHCKKVRVKLTRIQRCPLCHEPVQPQFGHSCRVIIIIINFTIAIHLLGECLFVRYFNEILHSIASYLI